MSKDERTQISLHVSNHSTIERKMRNSDLIKDREVNHFKLFLWLSMSFRAGFKFFAFCVDGWKVHNDKDCTVQLKMFLDKREIYNSTVSF